jgi:hypothetical protein
MRSMLAFILFAVSTLGGASDRTLVMPAMQPYFSDSGNAPYQRLTREIMRRSGSKIDTEYLPLAKSILMFDQNKNACYFAARELAQGTRPGLPRLQCHRRRSRNQPFQDRDRDT